MRVLAIDDRWVPVVSIGILLTVAGCGAVGVHDSHHVVGPLANMDRSSIAAHNHAALALYEKEAAFYPSVIKKQKIGSTPLALADTRPQTCVSFSGGGIRAAAFAIGVMKGLDDLPEKPHYWHDVDIISGASGGSYAVTWYLANLRDNHYTRDTIFGEESLKHLRQHADFIDVPMLSASMIGNILGIPFNLIGNGLFGWHLNTSGISTSLYEQMITNTFHGGHEMLVTDLKPMLLKHSTSPLPYPIVTTTWRIDEDQLNQESHLANSVVEVTPLWYGSDGLGYTLHHKSDQPDTPFVSLAELVEVSGSAVDASQSVGASSRVIGSAFNMDLGRYFRNEYDKRINPNVSDEQRPAWKKIAWALSPLGSYLFQRAYWRDAYGERMYLTDGGHAENLAAWPVIRRLCDQIIMVDAEYDPDYTFGAYFRLKHAVENELHTTMQLTPEPTIRLEVEKLEPTLAAKQALRNFDEDKDDNWRQQISASLYDQQYSILHGTIGPFPLDFFSSGKPNDLTLDFIYIKMAMNPKWDKDMLIRHYGEDATTYYLASLTDSCAKRPYLLSNIFWKCKFPMYSTLHQNFAPEQFAAYIGLGEHIVKDQLVYDNTCNRLRPERWTDCTQPKQMSALPNSREMPLPSQNSARLRSIFEKKNGDFN